MDPDGKNEADPNGSSIEPWLYFGVSSYMAIPFSYYSGESRIDDVLLVPLGTYPSSPPLPGTASGGDEQKRPECDRSNPDNARVLDFISVHRSDAQKIAAKAGIPIEFVLAVAGEETYWDKPGSNGVVPVTHNYFGIQVNSATDFHHYENQTGIYQTKPKNPRTPIAYVAEFSASTGFYDSGMGFATKWGLYVSGMTLADAEIFANTLHVHGFGAANPGYARELKGVITSVIDRINCK